ncbi:hypothetical protein FNO01nite_34470 [Flavobacterium noncentrifugens]|uniref:Uncharacterized protein n=1 Tax=Flavobacterium noncentrifugens TaxID=1128970 RepID=A0A1G9C222_9FLAO|nr:hypothetical protein [Flavobacterium noncentrifugens]GEP52775.1 hypothetical protein FNO01nite_34470 [Flavobacterium noncentrifugens]SDK45732.1 hypothetical protein SAMN04487935_3446 [Flavobacterium noncentrifugens]
MENSELIEIPKYKVYKDRAIWVGTFLGGPLVAGYLIAENFKAFGEPEKAKKTWIISIGVTILIFGGLLLIPENAKIPNQIIPIVYTVIAYYCLIHFQGQKINNHIERNGELYGWWRIIAIGIIGVIVTLVTFVSIGLLSDTISSPTNNLPTEITMKYGKMNHEIVFDSQNVSKKEADEIAKGFTKTTFFDLAITKYVYLKKEGSDYIISISCDESIKTDNGMEAVFGELRNDMQKLYPSNKIKFNLVVGNLDNIVKKLE